MTSPAPLSRQKDAIRGQKDMDDKDRLELESVAPKLE